MMRKNRYPNSFSRCGKYNPNTIVNVDYERKKTEKQHYEDSINRKRVLNEIEERCKNENLDEILNDIAQRSEIREQFGYLLKIGITDLSSIFKNWYQSYENNKMKNNYINIR